MSNPKFKYLEVIAYSPNFEVDDDYILKKEERVLFLGNIPNVPGHCAVVNYKGETIWLVHPEDFRKVSEDEL